jgi:hypothetical protein
MEMERHVFAYFHYIYNLSMFCFCIAYIYRGDVAKKNLACLDVFAKFSSWDVCGFQGVTQLVPVVSTIHLVVRELIGVHKPSLTQGCRKNLHKRGYSTMRAIR